MLARSSEEESASSIAGRGSRTLVEVSAAVRWWTSRGRGSAGSDGDSPIALSRRRSSETATGNGVIVGGRAADLVVIIFVRCSGRSGEEVAVLSASNAEADILPRGPKVPSTTRNFISIKAVARWRVVL